MTPRDDAHARMADLETKVRTFFTSVDTLLRQGSTDPALAPALTAIDDGLRELWARWEELSRTIDDLYARGGDSNRLREAGDGWTSFGDAVGNVAAAVAPAQMVTTIGWDGSAAEAYRLVVPAQHDALGQIKTSGVAISTSLHSLADQIDNFWTAIVIALVAAGVGVVAAAATALEVVTVPAAVAIAAAAIGVALAAVATGIVQSRLVLQHVESDMRTIGQNTSTSARSGPR